MRATAGLWLLRPIERMRPSALSRWASRMIGPSEDRAQVGLGVDVVDHPHVEIVGAQLPQLSFERVGALLRIARAQVLVVLPYGAEVALDDELPAPSFERRTDVGARGSGFDE